MSANSAELERLAHPEYWNERYAEVGPDEQVHEWFRSFNDLKPFFDQHIFQVRGPETSPRILHLGSGDSTIPEDFSKIGYKDQICVDFSQVVVQTMSLKHENVGESPGSTPTFVAWMRYHPSRPWDPPDEVLENTGQYIREIFRVLKSDGTFIYVTYRQPHFIRPLLNCKGVDWNIKLDILGGAGSSFEYSGFVLKKVTPSIVESAESAEVETEKGSSS